MIEFPEPINTCDVKVGTFFYLNHKGELLSAEFSINTCQDNQSKRVNDYNEQLTNEWDRLFDEGFTNIRFEELTPNPIF
jgi:hypothetical protein